MHGSNTLGAEEARTAESTEQIRNLRKQLAESWIQTPEIKLPESYHGELGEMHRRLLSPDLKAFSLSGEEEAFVKSLTGRLKSNPQGSGGLQQLLAAMLYLRPYQMPVKPDLQQLPDWFQEDYFRFLLESPLCFWKVGEVDEYFHHISNVIRHLYNAIRLEPDSNFWKRMALVFLQGSDFRPLYFCQKPLKDIYVQRGEIIAFALRMLGGKLDFWFPPRPFNRRKIRLGIHIREVLPYTEVFASLPVFEFLDQNKFEIFIYVHRSNGNPTEQYVRHLTDRFVVLPEKMGECASTIRADDLDVLFFCNNSTSGFNDAVVFESHRLARQQFVHFCNPGTTGIRNVDYFVMGNSIDPEDKANKYFSERLLKIKGYGICFDMLSKPKPSDSQVTRDNFSIPDGCTLFVSGANCFKIIPELRVIWALIVATVPESVLVLYPFGPAWGKEYPVRPFINEMQRIFRQYGISRDRLIVLRPFDKEDNIKAFLTLADVYLDAVPYSGATSLLDPLGVGVPPVVMEGPELRFCQGAAILRGLGMPELIAKSEEEYIKLAVRLATDSDFRKAQSEEISRKMEQGPPFLDPKSYAEEIGRVLLEMVGADGRLSKPTFDIDKEFDQAVQYHREGEIEKARHLYEKILEIFPEHSDALHLLGVVAHQAGNNEKAINLIDRAIQINPSIPYYYNNLGEALRDQGSLDAAISSYKKALLLKHDYPEAYKNMGSSFQAQGKLNEAISCYKKVLQTKPDWAEAHSYLGSVYQAQGRIDEAIACYWSAVEIYPEYFDAYYNMGMALKENRRLEEAIGCFKKAIQLKPDLAEAYNSLGIVLREQGKLDGAAVHYQKALDLVPEFAAVYNNLGNVFQEQGKLDDAIACYTKVLQISPDYADAYNQLVRQLEKACAWHDLKALRARLEDLNEKALEAGEKCPEMPLVNITRCADPAQNLAIARSWARDIARSISGSRIAFSFDRKKLPKQPITVGYISNDFRNHAVAHLICGLFGLHNRNEFKVFSYSYGPDDGSYYRKKIEQESDRFTDLRHLGDREAAKRIYEDQVHILVDLMGHTGNSRLAICAYRPAPVQVTYLGSMVTTGADFFDYIVTDRIVTPEEHESYYSEHLVYMPDSYLINDHLQAIADKDWKRRDLGLPEKGFVFCSFSQPFKIEPVMFDVWMNILRQVPGSVLWLLCRNESAEENLKREADSRGISSARLVFAEELPKEEHLARQTQADLVLDTRIYNGHTTTSDALWAGVPVITLQGGHFASRVSSSLLKAVGLPELITHSLKEYEELAVRLSRSPSELRSIRHKLEKNRFTEPLFDTPRFACNLEKAYKEMWRIFLNGERPRKIEIKEG